MLKGPLEADVVEASEACWTMDTKVVQVSRFVGEYSEPVAPALVASIVMQVKSKLLVSFRTRQVKVMVPDFIAEAEQQLLGSALKQWQGSAEGVVASSILEVKMAEQRLLHAVYRYHYPLLCSDLVCCCCLNSCNPVLPTLLQAISASRVQP